MRARLFAVAAFLALTGCATTPDQGSAEAEIGRVLDALHTAASRSDGKAYFDLYRPDAIFIGTDAGERWTMADFHAFADPRFARGRGWTYVPRSRNITLAPLPCRCVAWFDELLDGKSYGTSRGTGVLMQGPDGWKIAQYTLTIPVPNDLIDEMTKQIKAYEAKAAPPR